MQAAALSRRQREVQGRNLKAAAAVIYVRTNPGREIMLKGAGPSGYIKAFIFLKRRARRVGTSETPVQSPFNRPKRGKSGLAGALQNQIFARGPAAVLAKRGRGKVLDTL